MLVEEADGIHYTLKGAGLAAEIVMHGGGGPIEAQRHHLDAGIFHFPANFCCHQGTVGGHAHAQAKAGAVAGNVKNIVAQQRFTAGEYHHRVGIGVDLIEDALGLGQREIRMALNIEFRGGATVHTAQVAAAGDFPGDPFGGEFHDDQIRSGVEKQGRHRAGETD